MRVDKYRVCDQMECRFYSVRDDSRFCNFQGMRLSRMEMEDCMYFFVPDKLRSDFYIEVKAKDVPKNGKSR